MSISQKTVVKPCGPHQRATCSGCVHVLNTSTRGASIRRETISSRSATLVSASTAPLLTLQFLQVSFQAIKALFPEDAVMFQPVGGTLQRARLQPARTP